MVAKHVNKYINIIEDLINISASAGFCSSINVHHFRFYEPKLVFGHILEGSKTSKSKMPCFFLKHLI